MLAAVSLFPLAMAQAPLAAPTSTVVSILLPSIRLQTAVASVISVEPAATMYAVSCLSTAGEPDCGLGPSARIKYGPSTLELHITHPPDFTADGTCVLSANTANCTQNVLFDGSTQTDVVTFTGLSSFIQPVTVTAGLEKLSSQTGSPTTSTQTPQPSTTGPPKSSTSTGGGMPRMTQGAAVLAGVAAIVGGALIN